MTDKYIQRDPRLNAVASLKHFPHYLDFRGRI